MAILPTPGLNPLQPEQNPRVRRSPALIPANSPSLAGLRMALALESSGGATRVAAQAERDRGLYARAAVAPGEYSEGNIKKSTQLTGLVGYNQRAIPIPNSPDDMTQEEYMGSMLKEQPKFRDGLRLALSKPFQAFLSQPSLPTDYLSASHNMVNNLLSLAYGKKGSAGKKRAKK